MNRVWDAGDDPMNLIRLAPAKGGWAASEGTPFAGVLFYFGWALMKSLRINGQVRQFGPQEMPATLAALLEKLGIEAGAVVAEVDGTIVRPDELACTPLQDGQAVELVKFMGGG
jgi:thiamine biosynthesis protein ThiS